MNILFASDNNGVDMMAVVIYSIIKNNPTATLRFFIINSEITKENQARLKKLTSIREDITVEFVVIDGARFKNVELTNKTVSMAAYYRYLAPEILKSEDKVLYMDIDMLCLGSLDELYSTKLDGYAMAAVEDYFVSKTEDYPGFKAGIGFSKSDPYANSGLLLMNLAEIRETEIMQKFWENIHNKSKLIPEKFNVFADQTVTNITFKNKIKFLSAKYNVLTTAVKYTKQNDAVIVHFAGPDKPFTYRDEYSAKYDDLYYDYYNECMDIIGGNGNLMIKNTIRRLGKETSEAIDRLRTVEQTARDKSHHVTELADELANTQRVLKDTSTQLSRITKSSSWFAIRSLLFIENRIRKLSKLVFRK